MQDQILQVDENILETRLDRLVSEKVEQLLNAEADEITGAARYERTGDRKAYRVGHYERDLTVKAGTVTLKVPKLKGALFESAVIERYRRREQSVEEALIDMYLAGVSTRQVDDISRLLWGERMPSQTLSDKLKGVYAQIDEWRNRPLERSYPYLFVDGVWHKRTWGGSVENVSVLVAIGVDDTGHREVVGVAEGMKEDRASWEQFVRSLIERGLRGVRLVVGDRCAGLVATVNSMLPDARYQRCTVHFMRNVLSRVSRKHAAWAAGALKAVFAMESRDAALRKAEDVAAQMESRGLKAAASCLREGIGESTTYLLDDCLCSISCCGFSHDDFSGLGRACRPRNGLNWMVLVSPPERTGKDYDQHAPSTVYPSFAAERGIRRVDRAENTCRRSRRCVSTSRRRICRPCRR